MNTASNNGGKDGFAIINTVEYNKNKYFTANYKNAQLAREIQIKLGRPSTSHMMHIIKNKQLTNCPVTVEDIKAAEDIFGPDVESLKGKTVRRKPHRVGRRAEPIPPELLA